MEQNLKKLLRLTQELQMLALEHGVVIHVCVIPKEGFIDIFARSQALSDDCVYVSIREGGPWAEAELAKVRDFILEHSTIIK